MQVWWESREGRGEKVARGGRGVEGEVREGKEGWYDGGVGV